MDFSLTDEQTLLRDSVRKLMDRVATQDYVRRLDREQAYPYELYDAWVKAGLLRLPYPGAVRRPGRQRHRHGDHRRGAVAQERRLLHGVRRLDVLRAQHPAQGLRGAEGPLAAAG